MANVCIATVFLSCYFCIVLCIDTRRVVVELDANTPINSRHKRSVELPEELHFRFSMSDSSAVRLRLRREALVPVITSSLALEGNGVLEESGVYTDMDQGSSMIVRRNAEQYDLNGVFGFNGRAWEMIPSNESNSHEVSILQEYSDLSHDSFMTTEDLGEMIDELHMNNADEVTKQRAKMLRYAWRNLRLADTMTAESVDLSLSTNQVKLQHTVEISFIADFTDYTWFKGYYNSTAIAEMQLWYTYIAHMTNIRYDSIDVSDYKMNTVVTKLLIHTTDAEDDYVTSLETNGQIDGVDALYAIRNQIPTLLGPPYSLPVSDHYMYFTQLRFSALGMAFVGTACTQLGVSINLNTREASLGVITAHELGHSLSAYHDSGAGPTCSNDNQFVMAAYVGLPRPENDGNPWKFSECSEQAFRNFIARTTCTRPENTGSLNDLPARPVGEVPTEMQQCQRKRGVDSVYNLDAQIYFGGESIKCRRLYCSVGDTSSYVPYYAMEYTPCGTEKWCERGICVEIDLPTSTAIPTTTEEPIPLFFNNYWKKFMKWILKNYKN